MAVVPDEWRSLLRRRAETENNGTSQNSKEQRGNGVRVSLAAANTKRVSWNRSLSTRGRTSIDAVAFVDRQPERKKGRRKAKPPIPKAKNVRPSSFEKERAYFQRPHRSLYKVIGRGAPAGGLSNPIWALTLPSLCFIDKIEGGRVGAQIGGAPPSGQCPSPGDLTEVFACSLKRASNRSPCQ
ncbi:hypothetical protein CRG98_034673 [Punica granatum]|uniref:Uncharacterized protein n=1 Tax=Punica granatum TaxID=22663 RepID=A0A2I0IMI8_PUNGR|nr:hypothetical protein CRG98_034673 [Punica granatum]